MMRRRRRPLVRGAMVAGAGGLALKDGAPASRPGEIELDGAWRGPHVQRPVAWASTSSNNTARAMWSK